MKKESIKTYKLKPITLKLMEEVQKELSFESENDFVDRAVFDFCDYWLSRISESQSYNENTVN